MKDSLKAIAYALENGYIHKPSSPVLIIGDNDADLCARFPHADYITPFAKADTLWAQKGHAPYTTAKKYNAVILDAPQQKETLSFYIGLGLTALGNGGLLIAGAANDAGGKILLKTLQSFGVEACDIAKHKCRVVWTTNSEGAARAAIDTALHAGQPFQRQDGLWTQAGVFSWHHSDQGTLLLKEYIPNDIRGHVADFGCGIGELGVDIVAKNSNILSLSSFDHDQRAVTCCTKNLAFLGERHQTLWADIHAFTSPYPFDFIVMNPPFHTGKDETIDLGHGFLRKASELLRKNGRLLMVANTHLAYEKLLDTTFASWEELARKDGFKVIHARK